MSGFGSHTIYHHHKKQIHLPGEFAGGKAAENLSRKDGFASDEPERWICFGRAGKMDLLLLAVAAEELAGAIIFGVEHIIGGSLFDDHALVHEDDAICQFTGEGHFMRDDDHGHLFRG